MTISPYTCRICNTTDNHPTFVGREMMFGTCEEFQYFQCNTCECLQISDIPKNLGEYYPSDYTAHTFPEATDKGRNWFIHILQKQRCRTALFQKHYKLNSLFKLFVDLPSVLHEHPNDVSSIGCIITTAGLHGFDESILDVGCGIYSYWLTSLEKLGFTKLLGIDPLIPGDQHHGQIRIAKSELCDIPGKFSLITLHHSLEHIPNQEAIMIQIEQHLKPDGVCLIRIPIISSHAWEEYKTNWVEFDPPRHLYLHSLKSLTLLAKKAGLEVFDIQYDTTAFEFYGSEMYSRGIPLTDENSPWINANSSLFTKEEMRGFETLANKVNQTGQSGRAAFFLRKALA
jgi:SAM-dependent methyltransferase